MLGQLATGLPGDDIWGKEQRRAAVKRHRLDTLAGTDFDAATATAAARQKFVFLQSPGWTQWVGAGWFHQEGGSGAGYQQSGSGSQDFAAGKDATVRQIVLAKPLLADNVERTCWTNLAATTAQKAVGSSGSLLWRSGAGGTDFAATTAVDARSRRFCPKQSPSGKEAKQQACRAEIRTPKAWRYQ